MNRRLIVSSLVAAAVCGGLAAPALAGPSEDEPFKICVLGPTPSAPKQQGICVGWIASDATSR